MGNAVRIKEKCKRCPRTGVNLVSGLYSEVGPKELAESRAFADADRKQVAEAFGRWDQNGEGSVGPREFTEGMEKRRAAMKGKGKGGPGKGGPGKGRGRKGS